MRSVKLLLGILLAMLLISLAPKPSLANTDELFFVASEYELTQALRQKDTLQGLAISTLFYNKTSAENKEKVGDLIKHLVALKLRPIFLYGESLNKGLAEKLLTVPHDKTYTGPSANCSPLAFAMIFPMDDDTGLACGAENLEGHNEVDIRRWISDRWKGRRGFFLKH